MPRKPSKKTGSRKPRKYARRTYPKKKSTFASKVLKIVHSQIENKVHAAGAMNGAIAIAGSVTNPSYINCMPILAQGTGHGNRIGTQVNVVKSSIRGYVNLLPYNSTSNPCDCPVMVKMWLCRRKSNNIGDGDLPATADWATFFQSGTTSSGFGSNIVDMLLYPNREYWTLYSTKQFQLSNFTAQDKLATTVATTTINPSSGNVIVPFRFDLAKHIGKLIYNDASTNPSNKELFLVFQTVRCDGLTSAGSYAEYHYVIEHEYEDA